MSSGNKYHRRIYALRGVAANTVDVYCVLEAFDVRCPARQHAIKKLLCAGLRGKGDAVQDLREAGDAIARAIVLEEQRAGQRLEGPLPVISCRQCGQIIGDGPCERCTGFAPGAGMQTPAEPEGGPPS